MTFEFILNKNFEESKLVLKLIEYNLYSNPQKFQTISAKRCCSAS